MLTKYGRSALTNHLLGLAAFTMPAVVYLALFTDDPTDDGVFTDEIPSGVGYARQNVTGVISTSTGGAASENGVAMSFGPCASSDWGLITHAALVDGGTIGAGNILSVHELTSDEQRNIRLGDLFQLPISSLSVRIGDLP